MRILKPRHLAQAVLVPALVAGIATGLIAAERHLALVKSSPANSATLAKAPEEIALWFSQKPNLKLTRVVLTHGTDTLKTGEVAVADTSGKQVRASIDSRLGNGRYQITWRTVSRDGHAVGGKIAFVVDSAAKQTALSKR